MRWTAKAAPNGTMRSVLRERSDSLPAASNPPEGFGDLVRNYSERAFRFAFHLTGNVEESQDLVQEAFRKVLDRWSQYDGTQSLESWCFTVLRHLYFDHLREYERDRIVSLDVPVCVEEAEPAYLADVLAGSDDELLVLLERREGAKLVQKAVRRLSPEHKAVVVLCDIQGLSYEEAAEVVGCPVGTVRSRLSRAREDLKRLLLWYAADDEMTGTALARNH